MKQKQHIIPQVYLKQFGYQNSNGIWKIPTFDVGKIPIMNKIRKTLFDHLPIKSLLQEVNRFDIPDIPDNPKIVENIFQITETNYPRIIKDLTINHSLSFESKSMLLEFIAFLFVRTNDFRLIINSAIENNDEVFLNIITEGNTKNKNNILALSRDSAINVITVYSGYFIYTRLKHFKLYIIKALDTEKWPTTDNPVLIISKMNEKKHIDFMGIDTKVLFPISPSFLAFAEHPTSNISSYINSTTLIENQINTINYDTFTNLLNLLTHESRITKYMFHQDGQSQQD